MMMEIGPFHVITVYKQKEIVGQGPDHCHCQHPENPPQKYLQNSQIVGLMTPEHCQHH